VEYEDRIVIPTPEGVQIDYVLAGLGSRFTAILVDWILRGVALGALIVMLAIAGGGTTAGIVVVIALFLAVFGYPIAFEVWGGGRTPGKRWSGLRVVMVGGQPVSFGPSAVRNVVRLVDEPLTLFIAGITSILVTAKNQRLGDLAANTMVIREPRDGPWSVATEIARPSLTAPELDLTAVSPAELAAVRDFLARRDGLTTEARARVAQKLAGALAAKVGGLPPDERTPEWILEQIAGAARGR
jgi:uncharacterized RDD family membrane protein YckC